MQNLEGIKNIIFDLGAVILNIDYQLTISAFNDLGIDDFESIFSKSKQNHLSDLFETGKISESEFHQGIVELAGVNFSFNEYKTAWNSLLLDLPGERLQLLE